MSSWRGPMSPGYRSAGYTTASGRSVAGRDLYWCEPRELLEELVRAVREALEVGSGHAALSWAGLLLEQCEPGAGVIRFPAFDRRREKPIPRAADLVDMRVRAAVLAPAMEALAADLRAAPRAPAPDPEGTAHFRTAAEKVRDALGSMLIRRNGADEAAWLAHVEETWKAERQARAAAERAAEEARRQAAGKPEQPPAPPRPPSPARRPAPRKEPERKWWDEDGD